MSQEIVQEQAEKIAARVDAGKVGFDPATIIMILTAVLPAIMQCFKKDAPTPAEVSAEVKRQNDSRPFALRKRTARRIRGEADHPMTKEQSFALADAVIEEACAADAETVASVCRVCTEQPDE